MKEISKYSLGLGDRFAHQAEAQLQALIQARSHGIELTPVWNKSHREHLLIGSEPSDTRRAAEAAVDRLGWDGAYYIDADHIHLGNVDRFLGAADFYTIDVADFVGREAAPADVAAFLAESRKYLGPLPLDGFGAGSGPFLDPATAGRTAARFLRAMQEAGRIYRRIAESKGDDFIAEVSLDEAEEPQTPAELFLILAMLAREGVPVQTIAPKFLGRFNKGVDYAGDLARFERDFEAHLGVVRLAAREFGLPASLKLSVHSGSDKFSLYPIVNRLLRKHDAGIHVKTAGTTWLQELIGLAEAGGDALRIAQEIYAAAHGRIGELTIPYAPVLDIDPDLLPSPWTVAGWDAARYAGALRHDPRSPHYNLHFRQLLHVSFKVAAEMGARYTDALKANRAGIARNVTDNLLHRHILPLFGP